jgi:hypothetical protein
MDQDGDSVSQLRVLRAGFETDCRQQWLGTVATNAELSNHPHVSEQLDTRCVNLIGGHSTRQLAVGGGRVCIFGVSMRI